MLPIALERGKAKEALFIPILIRYIFNIDEIINSFVLLPKNGKPIVSWKERDEAYAQICKEIYLMVTHKGSQEKISTLKEKLDKRNKEIDLNENYPYLKQIDESIILQFEKNLLMKRGSFINRNKPHDGEKKILTYEFLDETVTTIKEQIDFTFSLNPYNIDFSENLFDLLKKIEFITLNLIKYSPANHTPNLNETATRVKNRVSQIDAMLLEAINNPSLKISIYNTVNSIYIILLRDDLEELLEKLEPITALAEGFSLS